MTDTFKWRSHAGRVACFDMLFTIINSVFMLMAVLNGLGCSVVIREGKDIVYYKDGGKMVEKTDTFGALLAMAWSTYIFFRYRFARNLLKSADKMEELDRALNLAIGWGNFSVFMVLLNVLVIFTVYYAIVAQISLETETGAEKGFMLFAILIEVAATLGTRAVFLVIVDQYVVELEGRVGSIDGSLVEVSLVKFF